MPTIPVHLHRIRVGLHQGDCRGFRVQTRLIGALKDPRADLPGLVIFHLEADTGRWYIICVHGPRVRFTLSTTHSTHDLTTIKFLSPARGEREYFQDRGPGDSCVSREGR
jgi:hypothetical protein